MYLRSRCNAAALGRLPTHGVRLVRARLLCALPLGRSEGAGVEAEPWTRARPLRPLRFGKRAS
eukprot:1608387-Prymnesium_polylepis.1